MALSIITRKAATRTVSATPRTNEQNDLILSVKKTKDGVKDEFSFGQKFFTESGLSSELVGGLLTQSDNASGDIFFAIVPADIAMFSKGRKNKNGEFNKGVDFQFLDILPILEAKGLISEDRELGDYFGFSLTPSTEETLEGATIYKLEKAELVGRIKTMAEGKAKGVTYGAKSSSDSESETVTTPQVTETVAPVLEEAPVVTETEEDWEA